MDKSILDMIENPQHSTKKELRMNGSLPRKKPPKLVVKRNLNRKLFPSRPVSLMSCENGNTNLSQLYDETLEVSYFDQCFHQMEKVGEGSFGEVYKVRSKEDDQYYAVKICKESFRGKVDRNEKVDEVRKYESVPNNENVVTLYNAWEQDDYVYLQMELGENSLERYSEFHNELTEPQLWNILLDMLLALKNLHDANLIHLDVKLENIIIFSDGSCKLGDFGLLINLKKDLHNAIEGDAKYVASELMVGKFTKAADVFSLGISMLELSCDLDLPSHGILWHNLRNGIFPDHITHNIPRELRNVIRRMMTKDHKRRPSIKCLLRHPRLKSMMKQRREARQRGVLIGGRLTPPYRIPNSVPSTPPLQPIDDASYANLIQATPPLGYSTPNLKGIMQNLNQSFENSLHATDTNGNKSTRLSPSFFSPLPSNSSTQSTSSQITSTPIFTSAKKLNFRFND